MFTIKFQYLEPLPYYPSEEKDTHKVKHVPQVTLFAADGNSILHRPFLVRDKREFQEWEREWCGPASDVDFYICGEYPADELEKNSFECYFHYLSFIDSNGRFQKCVVFCADVYIMNENGQTIDSFNA